MPKKIDGKKCEAVIDKMLGKQRKKESLALEAMSLMLLQKAYLKELRNTIAQINALSLKILKIKNKLKI